MNTFEQILEIKTYQKHPTIRAVYIDKTITWTKWTYYIYYYDMKTNTFYINDLDNPSCESRTSATNIIEHIITKAHYQELYALCNYTNLTLKHKKPKVYNITRQPSWLIEIDPINLKTIRGADKGIIWFKNPSWNINDSNKTKLRKIHQALLDFYRKKHEE